MSKHSNELLILDGGLGTTIENKGITINNSNLWSALLIRDAPQVLVEIHGEYIEAGANIVTSASYQFDFGHFADIGVNHEEATELLKKSILLVKQAAEIKNAPGTLIAASLGSYGAILSDGSEFTGNLRKTEDELYEFHMNRLRGLLDGASVLPDFLAFETVPCLSEVRAICRVLNDYKPTMKSWISMSCRDGRHLNSGEDIVEALAYVENSIATYAGFNCVAPQHVGEILDLFRTITFSKSLVIYPNRGESYENREWVLASGTCEDDLVLCVHDWMKRSVVPIAIIGGCCRTTPTYVDKLVRSLINTGGGVTRGG